MSADVFSRLYEEAMRDAYAEGVAVIDEAIERAEARRRFHVDSQGCAAIVYADPGEEKKCSARAAGGLEVIDGGDAA
jgi:hypothetical protein